MKPIGDLKLHDIMSRKVLCVSPGCRLVNAAQQMGDAYVSSLVVSNGSSFIGILTERDIVRLLRIRSNRQVMVGELMSTPVLTAPDELDFRSAFALFRQHRVRHLVVVDGQGVAIGIVSASDFRTHLALDVFRNIESDNGGVDQSVSALASKESLDSALELMMDRQSDELEIKNLQQQKSLLEGRLQVVLEASGLGVWEYDHANNQNHWSPGLCAMMGYPSDQAPASFEEWIAMIHPEDRTAVLAKAKAALADHGPLYEAEYRLRKQDGGWLWIAARGRVVRRDKNDNPLYTVGTAEDISQRQLAQEALQQEKRFSEDIINSLPGIFYLFDASGRFLRWNRQFQTLVGIDSDSLAKMTGPDFFDGEDKNRIAHAMAKVFAAGQASVEADIHTADGRKVPHYFSGLRTIIDGTTYLVGLGVDISRRKRAEQALEVEAIRRRILFEHSRDGIALLDTDGKVLDLNQSFADMLGYTQDEIRQFHVWDWDAKFSPDQLLQRLRGKQGYSWIFETRHRRKDGTVIEVEVSDSFVDCHGQGLHYGIHREITQRKLMESERKVLLAQVENQAAFAQAVIDAEIDGLAVCHAVADPPFTQFTVWNPSMTKLTGYSLEEINRLGWYQTVYADPEVQGKARHRMERMRQGEHILGEEWIITRKDGGQRTVQIHTATVAHDTAGVHVLAVMRDITERKRTEEHLRQLSTVVEQGPVSVVIADADARIVYANPRFTEITGYTLDEAQGQNPRILQSGLTPRSTYDAMWADLTAGKTWHGELRNKKKNGELFWEEAYIAPVMNPEGAITHYVAIKQNITRRKQIENELLESESRFHAIYEQSLFGIALVSIDEWCFIAANPAYCRMLGYTEEELRHKTVQDVTHPDDILLEQEFGGLPPDQLHDYIIDKRHLSKNGEVVWSAVASTIIYDSTGYPSYRLKMMEDTSHRYQAEQALKELNDSLEQRVKEESAKNREKDHLLIQQSRFAAMGEMIGNIAHQWRQPLNTLGLTLVNIEDAYNYHELTGEYLAKQVYGGRQLIQKMSSTIDDFRNFFRPHKEVEKFSVTNAIKDAISLVSASFSNHNIDIVLESGLDASIMGFSNEFSQVLLNLFSNAKDAILQNQVAKGKVRVKLKFDGQNVVITIADNGGGIPESILDKIFEPYFSTKELGTGIGLYMSKMIIENSMNGKISVRNQGNGAEFAIHCRFVEPPKDGGGN